MRITNLRQTEDLTFPGCMLEMRNNMIHYVQATDAGYAPCEVSSCAGNKNEANMVAYNCGANANMLERKVFLSISGEAFLLVVLLINFASRWHSEYANNIKKVRSHSMQCIEITAYLHTMNLNIIACLRKFGP